MLFSCTARFEIVVCLGFLLFVRRHSHWVGAARVLAGARTCSQARAQRYLLLQCCLVDLSLCTHACASPHPSGFLHTQTPHNPAGLLVHLHRHYNPSTRNQTNWSPCTFAGMHPQPRLTLCAFTDPLAQSHWSPCAFTGTHLQTHGAPCAFTWMHHHSKHQHKCIWVIVHNPEWVPLSSIHSHQVAENLLTRTCVSHHRSSTKIRMSARPQLSPPLQC